MEFHLGSHEAADVSFSKQKKRKFPPLTTLWRYHWYRKLRLGIHRHRILFRYQSRFQATDTLEALASSTLATLLKANLERFLEPPELETRHNLLHRTRKIEKVTEKLKTIKIIKIPPEGYVSHLQKSSLGH